ncbi:MAG: polyamine aminopropyltransferase [bacterium]|nr:polyamine aminopropyltransferase [bacterium]
MTQALGRHVLVELHDCREDVLNNVADIELQMIAAAHAAGATVINTTFHHFAPMGVSGVVVIQESHLSIHTWPEQNFAAVDIFTCGLHVDPWRAVSYLKDAFRARRGDAQEIPRGTDANAPPAPVPSPLSTAPIEHNLWFTERSENLALSLRHSGVVHQTHSAFQKIEILDTAAYGRLLVLDGQIMCSEKDEFVYHEMIAHVPALTHPGPEKVLVLGGGDGGAVRELARHRSIGHIDLVEYDPAVLQVSRTYLPSISACLSDSRVHIHLEEAVAFASFAPPESYDLILIDIPGLVALQSPAFYESLYRALKPGGIAVAQIPPPGFFDLHFAKTLQAQQTAFPGVRPYFAFIPTYATGMLSFSFAGKGEICPLANFDFDRAAAFTARHALKYYTEEMHRACFVVPPFVKALYTSGDT